MNVRSTDFRVEEGHKVNLDKWPTAVEPIYESKKQYQKILADHVDQLSSLQQLLYTSNRYAVLLIFQAIDAAGKDGAIRLVMSGVNPQGCQVFSYKHLSAMNLSEDLLPGLVEGRFRVLSECRARGNQEDRDAFERRVDAVLRRARRLDEQIVRTIATSTLGLLAQLRLLSAFFDESTNGAGRRGTLLIQSSQR